MTTWRELLIEKCKENNDDFNKLIISIECGGLDAEFDCGYGGSEGSPFTAWSDNFVYFPVVYDGAEWVGSVPRNPCDIKTSHLGGE